MLRAIWRQIPFAVLGLLMLTLLCGVGVVRESSNLQEAKQSWGQPVTGTVVSVGEHHGASRSAGYNDVVVRYADRTGALRTVEATASSAISAGKQLPLYVRTTTGEGRLMEAGKPEPWTGHWAILSGLQVGTMVCVIMLVAAIVRTLRPRRN